MLGDCMIENIDNGTITSVPGFSAGAICAGIKSEQNLDLGILYCDNSCTAASVFTSNLIKAAPVIISSKHLANKQAQAVVVNAGCANACTADQGLKDAVEMARLTADKLGINQNDVLIASTGLIGAPLPMDSIKTGIHNITVEKEGGHKFARAIMTTDTKPKEIALKVNTKDGSFTIGGVTKGAGMIHPNMATMLCFIATDAKVEADFLQESLKSAIANSFNMIDIDGDTSTNDTVFLLSSGTAGNTLINQKNGSNFQAALNEVCTYLAKAMVKDAEGATKFIEINVEGAKTTLDARKVARTVASSTLVKTAAYGSDPNWGRIMASLGTAQVTVDEGKIDIYVNDVCVFKQGIPAPFDNKKLRLAMSNNTEIKIKIVLNMGNEKAVAWSSDLSEAYVIVNSAYST
jgi:glutamate N-acetyltransferase/amino-acid N-acetyltransferase